ncbi:MAG TPA: hypothetical protein VMW00_02575 [Dehalococcoidales bacterium]|nr:hypothetical protein [Dehalococcoidales bacterium]
MTNEVKCWCRHCKTELPPGHTGPCPKCGKSGKDCKASATVSIAVVPHASLRARLKQKGFKKFAKEILQGWFPSVNPKLKKGVDKVRIVDKQKNEYHETVTDLATGEVIRDTHEQLSKHNTTKTKKRKTYSKATKIKEA